MSVSVSVVIPTYKSAQWVEETLESVVRQTHPADLLEIIVVDDKSPDDSVAVARRFLEKHPAYRSQVVAHEKNSGTTANRNSGWRLATGDWIQFLDADDLLVAHKVALQARAAAAVPENVAVIYTNFQRYQEIDGAWQRIGPIHRPFIDDAPLEQILDDLEFGFVGPTLIRKTALERVSGFTERPNIGEDCDLMMRIAMAGGEFRRVHSDDVAFLYRQWPDSLWRHYIKNKVAMRNTLYTFRSVEEFLRAQRPDGGLSEAARHGLAKRYSRWPDFFAEHDPETFRELSSWLQGLGYKQPLNISRGLSLLSSVIGYENALRFRSVYRKRLKHG
jgi:glycosyltransferase involved in cell wall biosynthesis